jgi:hypothetical protein
VTGHLKDRTIVYKDRTFDDVIANVKGEEKKMFIQFVQRMVKWNPEERSTAKELLGDPWLYSDFPQD